MVKLPRAGQVKSRLARDIGPVGALWWYRHQTTRLVRRLGRDARWQLVLAVAPDAAGLAARDWPREFPRIAQGRGDLGQRMMHLLDAAAGPVLVIGSDIPGIQPSHIARAFQALGRADMVLGPAVDGGFWLIGRRVGLRLYRDRLAGVRWSSAATLAETRAALSPLQLAEADVLRDVDRAADLPS